MRPRKKSRRPAAHVAADRPTRHIWRVETFANIRARAAERKGGADALAGLMPSVLPMEDVAAIPDDRWLAGMTKAVFQSGFSWKVIERKWPGFEEAFDGFDPGRVAMMDDDRIDELTRDSRIVRNAAKILATRENAVFVVDLIREHGSAGAFFASYPVTEQIALMDVLKKRAKRLSGNSGMYFLRQMGRDGYALGPDVVRALIRWGAVPKNPTSKRDLAATQAAFNEWREESGLPMAHISRTLAMSVDDED